MVAERIGSRVIINGDDFGMSPGVNQAIQRLHLEGRLNSASLMVNTPWSESAIEYARGIPNLRVGVHLNLTTGRPLLDAEKVPSLVRRDGSFYDTKVFVSRYLAGLIRTDEVEMELQAQMEKTLNAGLEPDHIDSHNHFHALPTLAKVVNYLAEQYDILAVRNPNLSAFVLPTLRNDRLIPDSIYESCGRLIGKTQTVLDRHDELLIRDGAQTEQLIYLRWCLRSGIDPAEQFQACIDRLNGSSLEIIAHPAEKDSELTSFSSYVAGRQEELDFLKSDSFLHLMRKNQLFMI